MMDTLCKLVIVCPKETADDIVEVLLEFNHLSPAFTTFDADGHGHDFEAASVQEQVRGRVARRVLWLVLPIKDTAQVLGEVASQVKNPHVTYWTEPILEFGHLPS